MRIIAIDPGTQRTGYATFEVGNRSSTLVECGKVFVRGKDLPEKLLAIHRGIERLFRRVKPRQVVIERPFVGKSARDAMTLNAARAVCMLAAAIMVVVSVLMRWLIRYSVPGDIELVQIASALAVFCFLPLCQGRRGNIMVDTFTARLPPRGRWLSSHASMSRLRKRHCRPTRTAGILPALMISCR